MPNQPKTTGRNIRVDDELWARAGEAAEAAGADRTKVITALLRWYVRQPGAKLPERPSAAS